MDNVTHSLFGLALARAGLNRIGPGATAVLIISANVPDSDIVAVSQGVLKYFEVHRAYTHSLLLAPLMALVSVLLAAAIHRRWIPLRWAFPLACLGVASHLLLDWINPYGIRFLLPFSSRFFYLDWNSLPDLLLLAILTFAFLWPLFSRLVSGEIGSRRRVGRGLPIAALILTLLLEATRWYAHDRAVAQLNALLYEDQLAVSVAALPQRANPFAWVGIVETSDSFRMFAVNTLGTALPEQLQTFRKLPRDAAINAARATAPFRYMEYFSRFPVWSEQPGSTEGPRTTRVELTDLRFGQPGVGSFHCVALLDGANRVLESQFTVGDGRNLGWVQK